MNCRICNKYLHMSEYIIKVWPFTIWEEKCYTEFCSLKCAKENMSYWWPYSIELLLSGDKDENKKIIESIFNINN